jgi:hypothetical protein
VAVRAAAGDELKRQQDWQSSAQLLAARTLDFLGLQAAFANINIAVGINRSQA